jgi:hypothetical protein
LISVFIRLDFLCRTGGKIRRGGASSLRGEEEMTTYAGTLLDRGGAVVNLMHPDFGVTGNGSTNDSAGVAAAYAAVPDGGTLFVPVGTYKITQALTFNRRVNIVGAGVGSAFVVQLATATDDAFTVNSAGASSSATIGYVVLRDFAILGGASSCRNGIVFNQVNLSQVDLHVRTGATEYGTAIRGCVASRFRIVTSVNYGYGETPAATPANAVHVQSVPISPSNNNHIEVLIEGGSGNGLRIEDMGGMGDNEITGLIEGLTGPSGTHSLYASNCIGMSVHDLYVEGIDNPPSGAAGTGIELAGCRSSTLGPGLWVVGPADSGKVKITGGRLVKLDGAYATSVSIDSTSLRTQVGALSVGTGGLRDASTSTVYLNGPEQVGASSHPSGAGAPAEGNRVANGDLSRWPTAFGVAGSAPTVAWTGVGQTDTTRFLNAHALRVSSTDTQTRLLLAAVQDADQMTGRVVTVWADVKWNSGADFRVGAYDGSQFLFGNVLPAGSSGFRRVAMTFVPTTSNFWVVVGGYNAAYDGYVGEIGAALGQVAPAGAESPFPSLQSGFLMGGREVTYGSAAPASSVGQDGDVVVNLVPAVQGSGSSAYFTDRWRKVGGGWKAINYPA